MSQLIQVASSEEICVRKQVVTLVALFI